MPTKEAKVINSFREMLERYIIPLICTDGTLRMLNQNEMMSMNKQYILSDKAHPGSVHIYPSRECCPPFGYTTQYKGASSEEKTELQMANKVLLELLQVSKYIYHIPLFPPRYSFNGNTTRERMYLDVLSTSAYEIGICEWLVNNLKFTKVLQSLLGELEVWAQSTYEGSRMPFGFIIDFSIKSGSKVNYLEFLKSPYSAVFSDGKFSGIMLDQTGHMVSHFLTEGSKDGGKYEVTIAPYFFSKFVSMCDTKSKIGVIAQDNGDILLAKEQKVVFAKRNGKWAFFPSNAIFATISEQITLNEDDVKRANEEAHEYVKKEISGRELDGISFTTVETDELRSKAIRKAEGDLKNYYAKQIYLSLLDVSFSHTGGCFAIVPSVTKAKKKETYSSFYSDLLDYKIKKPKNATVDMISSIIRRTEKKAMILNSIKNNCPNNSDDRFFSLHRNLRFELLSLDGAVIIDKTGKVLSAGAIVEINGGSDGGGRLAAAKQLAQIGFAVKVSEDGGIEGYGPCGEGGVCRLFRVR